MAKLFELAWRRTTYPATKREGARPRSPIGVVEKRGQGSLPKLPQDLLPDEHLSKKKDGDKTWGIP